MPPVIDVLGDLRARRESLLGEMQTLSAAAMTAEQRGRFAELDGEITALDGEVELRERQVEREQRAASARAASGQTGTSAPGERRSGSGWQVGEEPNTYGRGSGHSYFLDMARVAAKQGRGDGGVVFSEQRLARHAQELAVDIPRRAERRAAAAASAFDRIHATGSPAERRAQERALAMMDKAGVSPFERESRALSRTDGAGGYEVPPLWLIDELVPYLRAGRTFADLLHGMPLPAGTDSINIPRLTVGSATGPQVADGAPVNGRDMSDNFVNAKVQTIAGQQDVGLQLLDQSPIAFDELILGDLSADYNSQLSGQCFVGSGTAGQITGIWPGGVISNTNGIYIPNTNNTSGQTWVNGGGATPSVNGSVFQAGGQMLSLVARTRLRPPTHHVWHPWVWYYLLTQVDQSGRPLVVPGTPNNTGFNMAAVDNDGPVVAGPVGWYQGLPVILDPQMPVTFPASGGTNPQITTLSSGQFAISPGSGVYTPVLCGLWDDCYLWEGEMRTRALTEVLSGSLQVRFQLYNYVASLFNRYQAYSAVLTGTGPITVAQAGSAVSYATLTQYSATPANSVLNMMNGGF
ncbi:HK97 family phage major capsid protein [Kitasatospora sp. MAP12-15]|uniref:phage major capsid protein n=1 Tax=unclassified Kitasatospora TaxID=2633591 RepID=UPI002476CF00|nr:phage major capsid protein [Kitasatospora sp. MAP12-44]MDH6111925.1 HK97 family phage major capsid protein [Kitasatospora sp. MAP12-44]